MTGKQKYSPQGAGMIPPGLWAAFFVMGVCCPVYRMQCTPECALFVPY